METKQLIDKLTNDTSKVKLGILSRMLIWTVLVFTWVFIGIFFGKYDVLNFKSFTLDLWIETALIIIATLFSGFTALFSASNTYRIKSQKKVLNIAVILLTLILLLLICRSLFSDNSLIRLEDFECTGYILLHSVVPGFILYGLTLGLGESSSKIASFFCISSAVLIGVIAIQFSCLHRDPIHQILFHVLPVIILGTLGIFIAKKYFSLETKINHLLKKLS